MTEEKNESADTNPEEVDLDIPDGDDPDMDEWWTWSNFARLFIVPLIIVVVAVFIYGFFQFMLNDQRAVGEYIDQMKVGSERARWRAAFDLAQKVQHENVDKELTLTEVRQIIRLYRRSDDPRVRMYLARVLGHVPSPDSREALVDGLSDTDPGVRYNAIAALGQMRADREIEHIVKRLEDAEPSVRRVSAYVLGSLGNKEAVEPLKTTLDDSVKDVRWNGAIALARLGDVSGKSILIKNLKQARDGKLDSMDPQLRANLVVNTIKAVGKISVDEVVPLLEEIKENDPAPSVREQALKTLETMRSSNT